MIIWIKKFRESENKESNKPKS